MVGGFYASGLNIKELEEIALGTDWRRIFSTLLEPSFKKGLIGGEKLKTFIEQHTDRKNFETCKIPFAAVATDLKTGEIVVLDEGEMAPAIRASISIPLIFKPVEIDGRTLADGGLSAPVPAEITRKMGANIVIAVNLDKHYYDEQWKPGWYDIANDSLNILRHHLALLNTVNADIVIEINTGKTFWYKFVNGRDKILAGEKATKEMLPKLQKMIYQKSERSLKKYLKFFQR
jgi:NTE family protein